MKTKTNKHGLIAILAIITLTLATTNCKEDPPPDDPHVPQPTQKTLSFGDPACIVTISSPDEYTNAAWTALVGEVAAALEAAYDGGNGAAKSRFEGVFGADANGKIVFVNNLSNNWEVRAGEFDTLYLKTSSISTADYRAAVRAMVDEAPGNG